MTAPHGAGVTPEVSSPTTNLEQRVAELERRVSDLLDVLSAGFGHMHGKRWSAGAYSRHSRLGETEQKKVLESLDTRGVKVVFLSDVNAVVGAEPQS